MPMMTVGANWGTLLPLYTNPEGLALVEVTGTVTWDDLYQHADLKEKYIFKRDTAGGSQITGGGFYDAHITLHINSTDAEETDLTITNAIIRLWGRLVVGSSGGTYTSTLNLGEKNTNSREAGVILMQTGWRSMVNVLWENSVINRYDSQLIQTSGIIQAGALGTGVDTRQPDWGDDYSYVLQSAFNDEVFDYRFGEKLRFANNNPWSVSETGVRNISDVEFFYQSSNPTDPFYIAQWVTEGADIPLNCAGNSQATENGVDVTFDRCKVIDAATAEVGVFGAPYNINISGLQVVGGTASNDDFTVSLDTNFWHTGHTYQRDFRIWQPVSVTVYDNATDLPIVARVRIYINSGTSTLAKKTDLTTNVVLSDWDQTTDANGEVALTPLLITTYEPGGLAAGIQTDTLSNLVTGGYLAKTAYNPFVISIQSAGYRSYQATLDLDGERNLVIGLDPPATNPNNILPIFVSP